MQEEINEVITELRAVLEASNDEVFFIAVQELINTHQMTKSHNPMRKWDILLLPHFYDPDAVLEAANETAYQATVEVLEDCLG